MGHTTFPGFPMESRTGFSTITWVQRNPNLDSEKHSIFHKQRCMPSKEPLPQSFDLCIWFILETRVLATPHSSLEPLKVKLQREWEEIPHEQIRTACDAFVNRLSAVVRDKDDYIE
ncbi:hypothetical protein FHG87_021132 [Trinorchestia longiramus]|nr:hypothetical protein FHG87_021132 [Trinorchestia longiramus]